MWTLEQVVRYLKALTERRGPRGGVLAINEQGTIVARGQRAKDLLAAQERRGSKAEPEPKGRAKAAEKPGKKSKPSVADSMQTIRQLAETGGPKAQAKMEEIIASHTVSEIGDLKKMLGIRASGTKAVLVAKVAEKAIAMMGKPAAKPKAKPGPAPSESDIADVLDRHRRGEIDLAEAIETLKKQFAPMANALAEVASHIVDSVPKKTKAGPKKKPEPKEKSTDKTPVSETIQQYNKESESFTKKASPIALAIIKDNYDKSKKSTDFHALYNDLQEKIGPITISQFQDIVKSLHENKDATLYVWNDGVGNMKRSDLALMIGQSIMYSILPKDTMGIKDMPTDDAISSIKKDNQQYGEKRQQFLDSVVPIASEILQQKQKQTGAPIPFHELYKELSKKAGPLTESQFKDIVKTMEQKDVAKPEKLNDLLIDTENPNLAFFGGNSLMYSISPKTTKAS